jgi:hypothetical protein
MKNGKELCGDWETILAVPPQELLTTVLRDVTAIDSFKFV